MLIINFSLYSNKMTEPLATDEVGFPLFNKSVILNIPDFLFYQVRRQTNLNLFEVLLLVVGISQHG